MLDKQRSSLQAGNRPAMSAMLVDPCTKILQRFLSLFAIQNASADGAANPTTTENKQYSG
jgi:hypothetical protein